MAPSEGRVPVVVKTREVVTAVLPVTETRLALSNLDLLLPPLEVGIFLCYANGGENNEMMLSTVKKGLRQVLVPFNPLAGEVVLNNEGEPELFCNNRGVDFVEAFADINLQHLDIYNADVSIRANFVPIRKHGVFTVQVTKMKCGGFVIGCNIDHRVADAHSINKFLVAWADISRSNNIRNNDTKTVFDGEKDMLNNYIPFYHHLLLKPRQPSHYDPAIHNMYVTFKAAAASVSPPSFQLESRVYHIDAFQIQRLQFLAGSKRTKLESFSALLWKLLAKSCQDDEKRSKLGIVVNGRNCLSRSSSPISMENYFGNVLSIPYSDASVGELKSLPLFKIANVVHACVESAANEEHFRGLVDWVEDHRPHKAMSKIYSYQPSETEVAAVVVSSGLRFPVTQLDFGCGLPSFASYYFPWGGSTGYVMPMPSATNDGDWIVFMHLPQKQLDFVEKEAPHFFKPFVF